MTDRLYLKVLSDHKLNISEASLAKTRRNNTVARSNGTEK